MSPFRIIAIVPIHNGMPHILTCLDSLRKEASSDFTLETLVIDDGSQDGSTQIIRQHFPSTTILPGNGSLWWTGAASMGTDWALNQNADYIFLLNHDDTLEPGTVHKLLEFCLKQEKSVACSAVLLGDQSESALCGYNLTYFKWYLQPNIRNRSEITQSDFVLRCDLNGGHGVLIPLKAFKELSPLWRPKLFPHYAGDFDFYFQIRKAGYQPFIVGGAVVKNTTESSGLLSGTRLSKSSQIVGYLTSRRSVSNLRDRPLLALLNFPWGLNFIWAVILFAVPIFCSIFFKFRRARNGV